jgi:capsular exopolysaccharide synthesis family protein
MSRVFEALRRVEQLNNPSAGDAFPAKFGEGKDVLNPFPPEGGGLRDLERVTCHPRPESHLLCRDNKDFGTLERFKLLRYRLYELRRQRAIKSILITSAIPKEGKSMVAANLAITLAQASDRVLLIDADLRKPTLDALLGLHPGAGLAEILKDQADLMRVCRRIDPLGICLLSAGHPPVNPVELIQGELMQGVVKTAASTFDWVVIDSPPVLPLADGRFLAALCDTVFLVAREAHTRREQLQETLAALKGAPTAGVILNSSRSADGDAYSQYYSAIPRAEIWKHPSALARQIQKALISKGGRIS